MKNVSNQFDTNSKTAFCSMCGAINGDFWETRPIRSVKLDLLPRYGDIKQPWIVCDECGEGLRGLNRQRRGRMGASSS